MTTTMKPLGLEEMEKYLNSVQEFRWLVRRQRELRIEQDKISKQVTDMDTTLPNLYATVQNHYPDLMPRRDRYNASAFSVAEFGDLVLKFYHQEVGKGATGPDGDLFGIES